MSGQFIPAPGGTAEPIELAAVLARATQHRPVTPDDFARDQTTLRDLVDANEAERDDWLTTLTMREARYVLAQLDSIATEHRRRANTADSTAEWIRGGLAAVAREGTPEALKVSGSVAR